MDPVSFSVDHCRTFRLEQVSTVDDRVKCLAETVGVSNVFHEPQSVHNIIFDSVVVGKDIVLCQAETRDKPAVGGICGLTGKLRLGIDNAGAVHAAGAYPHHDPLEPPEPVRKTDPGKKRAFRGHMTSPENNEIIIVQGICFFLSVPGVTNIHTGKGQPCILHDFLIVLPHPVVDTVLIRKSGDQQTPGSVHPEILKRLYHPVVRIEAAVIQRLVTPVYPDRTARQEKLHHLILL